MQRRFAAATTAGKTGGHRSRTAWVCAITVAGAMPATSLAQRQPDGAGTSEPVLGTVEVRATRDAGDEAGSYVPRSSSSGTKMPVPLRDVPQTINVVPAAVLQD